MKESIDNVDYEKYLDCKFNIHFKKDAGDVFVNNTLEGTMHEICFGFYAIVKELLESGVSSDLLINSIALAISHIKEEGGK